MKKLGEQIEGEDVRNILLISFRYPSMLAFNNLALLKRFRNYTLFIWMKGIDNTISNPAN